jgi:DedD protein
MHKMANDSEITVTTGKMLGLFVVLVVVCALFFGFGYAMGKGAAVSASNGSGGSIPAVVVMGQRTAAKNPAPAGVPADSPKPDSPKPDSLKPDSPSPVPAVATEPADAHIAGSGYYFVQIAAVRKQEDAEALVESLRKKDYAVFSTNNAPADKLFHVQIGPFSNQKDAEGLRTKLVGDGYNPIVKK